MVSVELDYFCVACILLLLFFFYLKMVGAIINHSHKMKERYDSGSGGAVCLVFIKIYLKNALRPDKPAITKKMASSAIEISDS